MGASDVGVGGEADGDAVKVRECRLGLTVGVLIAKAKRSEIFCRATRGRGIASHFCEGKICG